MSRPAWALWKNPIKGVLVILFKLISIVRPLPKSPNLAGWSPKRILIFSTAGIGDTLSDTPAIRAVKESLPAAHVAVVVHRKRKAVLASNPWIDSLISHHKGILQFFLTLKTIRALRPDIAIILRANDPDIWPLAYLSGADVVLSRPENTVFPFLVNCPARIDHSPDLPGVVQTLDIVKHIGATTNDPRIVYAIREEERREMEVHILFRKSGPNSDASYARVRVAVQIHHSPRLLFRDWPVESFVDLCRMILEKYPVQLFLTGGPADIGKGRAILDGLQRLGIQDHVVNFIGKLGLRETAALLDRCACFVTTDTGIMHLGFALNISTLALLHPYNARRVGPHGYGSRHRVVVMQGPESGESGLRRALTELKPETVFTNFEELYKETIS